MNEEEKRLYYEFFGDLWQLFKAHSDGATDENAKQICDDASVLRKKYEEVSNVGGMIANVLIMLEDIGKERVNHEARHNYRNHQTTR